MNSDSGNSTGRRRRRLLAGVAATAFLTVSCGASGSGPSSYSGDSGAGYADTYTNDGFRSDWNPGGNFYTGDGYAFDADSGCMVFDGEVSC